MSIKVACDNVCSVCDKCRPLLTLLGEAVAATSQVEDFDKLFRKAIEAKIELDNRSQPVTATERYEVDCRWAVADKVSMIDVLHRALRRRNVDACIVVEVGPHVGCTSPPTLGKGDAWIGVYTMRVSFENGAGRSLASIRMTPSKTNALLLAIMQIGPVHNFDTYARETIRRWFEMESTSRPMPEVAMVKF
jgi:hypothetical protein